MLFFKKTQRCFIILLSLQNMQAQDFHLSMPDASPFFLNPAMAGTFDGDFRGHGHYRTQWSSIATKPFVTTNLSFETKLKKKLTVGGQILDYRAGAGNYNVLSFLPSAAYGLALDSSENHHLSFGLQAGFIHKSINTSLLIFGNQYSNENGGGFNNTIPNDEPLTNTSVFTHDINAGIFYYYANNNSVINPFMGVSAFHLTQPTETFFSTSNRLPLRYVVHGGCKVNVTDKIQVLPKFMVMRQLNDKEFTTSLLGYYWLKESDMYIVFGPTYRNKDAAVFETGMKYGAFLYRMCYDINISTLQPTTNGRGGFELSITYIAKKPKVRPVANNCSRL